MDAMYLLKVDCFPAIIVASREKSLKLIIGFYILAYEFT